MGAGQDLTHNIPRHWWTVTPNEMRRPETINKPLAWHFLELSDSDFFFSCLPHSWEACGILVSPPGAKPEPLAVKAQSPNHWTTREFPLLMDFLIKLLFNRLVLLGYRELFCLPGGLSPLDEWQVYLPIIKNPLAWSHEFQHHIYQWKKKEYMFDILQSQLYIF